MLAAASSVFAAPVLAEPVAFERPRTLMALLQNMKRAAEAGLLLERPFYDDASLKNAFAATHVVYGRPLDGINTYGTVAGFGVLADTVRVGGTLRESMQLDFTLTAPADGRPEGNLRLSFLIPKRNFDDIEAAFGKGWKETEYRGPGAYASRHHGSSAISYSLGDPSASPGAGAPPGRWMNFSFDPRAQLELVTVASH